MYCNLCPRKCNVNRDINVGVCRQNNDIKVARAALHYDEEPCISGKDGSGTIFFTGCSLNCVYCQNYKISKYDIGKTVSVKRLSEIFLELQEKGALNINLVTPTHFILQIIKALDLVKNKLKISVIYNTSGYENISTLKMCENYIDIYLTDIKYFNSDLSYRYSCSDDYFTTAKNAFSEMLRQKELILKNDIIKQGVILRHMVLPGHRADSIKILEEVKSSFGTNGFILSLMSQFTPNDCLENFPEINRKITSFEYNSVIQKALELGFNNGYIQDKSSAQQKYTPQFDLSGV